MSIFNYFNKDISEYRKKIKTLKKQLKAMANEGAHSDILSTSATGTLTIDATQKKNMYKTYPTIVQAIYDMFNAYKDFGGEFIKSVLRTRVAFIAGGGVTVISENDKTREWANKFLDDNKLLEGSNLFKSVLCSEMEGQALFVLLKARKKVDQKDMYIKAKLLAYYYNKYIITRDDKDDDIIKSIEYKGDGTKSNKQIAKIERLTYIKTGGDPSPKSFPIPPGIGNCLTDIENASRIKYDMRYNNHLFGRLTPAFKTSTQQEANALYNVLDAIDWKIGRAFVGSAEFKLVGPPPEATEVLIKELITACRIISMNTGIPIHWLSWPDLMSNRATAENLLEVINAATIMEREIWEEGITELVRKAMAYAYELGLEGSVNDPDGFKIQLPLISEAMLKLIQEVWIPLEEGGYITKDSVRNKIPGINPVYEKRVLEKEKNERLNNIKNKFRNDLDVHDHEETEEEEVEE